MQNNKQTLLSVVIIGLVVGLSLAVYKFYHELRRVKESIELVEDRQVQKRITEQSSLAKVDTAPAKKQRWSALQSKFQNAVLQIFTQSTEFNWVEPYKSPNQKESSGSAFFINEKGDILTNAHVVNQAVYLTAQIPSIGKRRFQVSVVGMSPERDLALLRMPEKELVRLKSMLGVDTISYLTIGDSDAVQRGDKIMALGFPLGQHGLKSTTGVVSGREHIANHGYFIQISAAINPGNSGGPSIDSGGRVVGVNSAGIPSAQNIGYIIPSNEVLLFLDQLATLKEIPEPKLLRKPFLGVFFNRAANDNLRAFLKNPKPGGLYVVDVYKGGPFDKAGIQAGDMIYKIDSYPVDMHGEMSVPWSKEDRISIVDYVARLKLGHKINLEYYRDGSPLTAKLTLEMTEPPIKLMYPGFDKIDYEVLGGFVFMPLTLNHVLLLSQFAPHLMQYADPKKEIKPALLITHVMLNSPASKLRSLGAGGIITEVNGKEVQTLDEFRVAVLASTSTGYLTIKTSDNQFAVVPIEELIASEEWLSKTYHYPLSEVYKELKKRLTK